MKRIEIFFKDILLKLLLFLFKTDKGNQNLEVSPQSHILFIRLNKIGDALVTTPLIKIIKEAYGCQISVLCDRKNHFIFTSNKYVDNAIVFNKGLKGFKEFRDYIISSGVDIVVDLHDDVSTTVSFLLAISGVPVRIGLDKDNSKLYTHTAQRLDSSKYHVVERNLELLSIFGIDKNRFSPNIVYDINENERKKVKRFLKDHVKTNSFLIGINISAGSEARFWGADRYKKLIEGLRKHDVEIVLLSSPADKDIAHQIAENKIPVFNTPDFNEFAAMISELNLLFTPDTSIVHIASAYEIPVFGIYVKYNTQDMIWSPYKSKFECVITEEPNFLNLEFEQVYPKFALFLKTLLHHND